jgi:hypothetical protein
LDPRSVEAAVQERALIQAQVNELQPRTLQLSRQERFDLQNLKERSGFLRDWIARENRQAHNATSWELLVSAVRMIRQMQTDTVSNEAADALIAKIQQHVSPEYWKK